MAASEDGAHQAGAGPVSGPDLSAATGGVTPVLGGDSQGWDDWSPAPGDLAQPVEVSCNSKPKRIGTMSVKADPYMVFDSDDDCNGALLVGHRDAKIPRSSIRDDAATASML